MATEWYDHPPEFPFHTNPTQDMRRDSGVGSPNKPTAHRGPSAVRAAALDAQPVLEAMLEPSEPNAPGEGDLSLHQLREAFGVSSVNIFLTAGLERLPAEAISVREVQERRQIFVHENVVRVVLDGMNADHNQFGDQGVQWRRDFLAATHGLDEAIGRAVGDQVDASSELGLSDEEHRQATNDVRSYVVGQWLSAIFKPRNFSPLPDTLRAPSAERPSNCVSPNETDEALGVSVGVYFWAINNLPDRDVVHVADKSSKTTYLTTEALTKLVEISNSSRPNEFAKQADQWANIQDAMNALSPAIFEAEDLQREVNREDAGAPEEVHQAALDEARRYMVGKWVQACREKWGYDPVYPELDAPRQVTTRTADGRIRAVVPIDLDPVRRKQFEGRALRRDQVPPNVEILDLAQSKTKQNILGGLGELTVGITATGTFEEAAADSLRLHGRNMIIRSGLVESDRDDENVPKGDEPKENE